eukprot:60470-Amphidinium_carterae.4
MISTVPKREMTQNTQIPPKLPSFQCGKCKFDALGMAGMLGCWSPCTMEDMEGFIQAGEAFTYGHQGFEVLARVL